MKTVIILYMLVLLSTAASAEIYRWEDANGVHFTDDAASLPEQYRVTPPDESGVQPVTAEPRGGEGMYPQNMRAATRETRAADRQANLEQQRQVVQTKKQQQINSRDFDATLQSLAKYIVIGVLLGFCLFVVWIVTIVDIVRSGFITPSSKAVWLLLVIFLPLLGMLLYMVLGSNQKSNPVSGRERPHGGVLIGEAGIRDKG